MKGLLKNREKSPLIKVSPLIADCGLCKQSAFVTRRAKGSPLRKGETDGIRVRGTSTKNLIVLSSAALNLHFYLSSQRCAAARLLCVSREGARCSEELLNLYVEGCPLFRVKPPLLILPLRIKLTP